MKKCYILGVLLFKAFIGHAQQPPTLQVLQQTYETRQKTLVTQYAKSLDAELASLKKKGDLDNFLLVQAEAERLSKESSVPLQKEAKAAFKEHCAAHDQRWALLSRQYLQALDALIKAELIAGRIESAKEGKTEKEKITALLEAMDMPVEEVAAPVKPKPKEPQGLNSTLFEISTRTEFESDGSPKAEKVPLKDEDGLWNLSLLKTASPKASSLIPGYPTRHQIVHLNDGWYHNSASWIASSMPAWAEIDLGADYWIKKVAFGSNRSLFWKDRAAAKFKILVATDYSPQSQAKTWKTVYEQKNGKPVRGFETFIFKPVKARYVRVDVSATVDSPVRMEELEIYGSDRPL